MKKAIFILMFLLTKSNFCHSQNAQEIIDGLKKELKTNPDAKKTATIYSDLTWYYSNIEVDSALYFGKKALIASQNLQDSVLIAQVYSDIAAVYYRKGEYQNSKNNYLKAAFIRKKRKDFEGIAKVNANLANIYNKLGNKKGALESYLTAVDYFEKSNKPALVAMTNANIGYLFHENKNYSKSLKYLNDAIVYQEKNNLTDGLCTSYLTKGNVYLKLNDTIQATFFYNKCIKAAKSAGNKIAMTSAFVNLATIKSNQKKQQEAKSFLNISKKLQNDIKIKNNESSIYLTEIKELIHQKKHHEAKTQLLVLKKKYENHPETLDNLVETYQLLTEESAYLNQMDSVIYYNRNAINLQNKWIETLVLKQTNELETKYQTAKKEKLLLEKDIQAKQKNTTILILSILALFVAVLGFLFYRQQKLKVRQQKQEYKLKKAIAQIETQNKLHAQRINISRDLHDNIGSQLTFIISSVDNIKYGFDITNPKLDFKLSSISEFAKSTILELRDTIWAMNNNEIKFEDLKSRIFNFIEKAKLATENIEFIFEVDEVLTEKTFTSIEGMNLYRTIQEAVNNSVKYANPSQIVIKVQLLSGGIEMIIQDNGQGFDTETVENGNGIKNMHKRIEEIGGKFVLLSTQKGTKIQILLK